jgi:hypothetical protein
MKTTLIVFAILILLGIVIFLLIRKPEKVIDDDSIVKPADADIDKGFVENHQGDKPQDGCLQESKEKETEEDKAIEVNIPEHCRIPKQAEEVLPNKYFFNVHKYTSRKGREIFCVVCSAIINNKNYRIIVKNSYYPYIKSYTTTLADKIRLMFENDKMSVEDFVKLGSTNFTGVGEIVESF